MAQTFPETINVDASGGQVVYLLCLALEETAYVGARSKTAEAELQIQQVLADAVDDGIVGALYCLAGLVK